jgi:hypothetical protein
LIGILQCAIAASNIGPRQYPFHSRVAAPWRMNAVHLIAGAAGKHSFMTQDVHTGDSATSRL